MMHVCVMVYLVSYPTPPTKNRAGQETMVYCMYFIVHMQPIVIVPENLEPPQLLNLLNSDKIRRSTNKHPTHTLPLIFGCEVNKGVVTFTQLQQPVAKKNLQSDKCYLLTYKDMV